MTEAPNPVDVVHTCSQVLEGYYGPLVQTLGVVFFILIFNFLIRAVLLNLRTRLSHKHNMWAFNFVSALHKPLSYFVWFVAGLCAVDTVISSISHTHLAHIHTLLSIGAVLASGWFLMRLNNKVVNSMTELSRNNKISYNPTQLDIIKKVMTIVIIFVTAFFLLDVTNQSMQTILAFGGIGGLALAFASQQVISNFFGGLMVYITKPFSIGEWVHLPERQIEGHIEEIGWYLTRVRSFDKRPIYVPNSIFTQTIVITPSRMSHERFHHTIGLRYCDIKAVKPIIEKIKRMLKQHPSTDHHLPIDVFFKDFGTSTLDIEMSAYILTGKDFAGIRQELLLKVDEIVKQEGAEIATPTNIVELHGGLLMKNNEEALAKATNES